jgi:hypothetical protein
MLIRTVSKVYKAASGEYYVDLDVYHWGIDATILNMDTNESTSDKYLGYSVDEVLDLCFDKIDYAVSQD